MFVFVNRALASACGLLVLAACADDSASPRAVVRPDAAPPSEASPRDAGGSLDGQVQDRDARADGVRADASATDAGPRGCAGPAPSCFVACSGDDVLDEPARCTLGAWRCAAGTLRTDCPADACFGVPLPGEVCESGAFTCRPEQTDAFTLCPRFACPSCDGFEGPISKAGCRCSCDRDAGVRCQKL